MSKASTSLIQNGLRDLGYDPGPLDGVFGVKTEAAAAAWLLAKGRPVTGAIQSETKAMIYQGKARHPVHEIVLHCSATRPEWMDNAGLAAQRAEIRRWHMEDRDWRDIGYHWLVGRAGGVLAGRAENEIGAGVLGHNNGVIHICLVGGFDASEHDKFSEHFTSPQAVTVRQLIQNVSMRTQITLITGHNDYAAKACPGFNVANWLKEGA